MKNCHSEYVTHAIHARYDRPAYSSHVTKTDCHPQMYVDLVIPHLAINQPIQSYVLTHGHVPHARVYRSDSNNCFSVFQDDDVRVCG